MSTLPNYTPGPWHYDDDTATVDSDLGVTVAGINPQLDRYEANAALIAAAPELLMWLEFAVRRLRDIDGGISDHARDDIYRVIAKSKGRS